MNGRAFLCILSLALLAGCAQPVPPSLRVDPAALPADAFRADAKPGWQARHFMVAAAHPLAADAGYQVLRAGGSAVDGAIAVQMVLALVEPQSSGIGGGAFLLHHDGRRVEAYDGRETAPAAATPRLFLADDGRPLPYAQVVATGRPVGVPGVLRMLELAHREHGKLPWAKLFQPAIALAEQGFPVSPRLAAAAASDPHLRKDAAALAYLFDAQGKAVAAGSTLRNPAFARVLRRVAHEGADAFYRGEIARAIVDKVRGHPVPGTMTASDLAGYQPKKREPLCHAHETRGRAWRLCGFPPPSSGAIALGQILGLLRASGADALPLAPAGLSPEWLHLYLEAGRLAFADRALYVADPDFTRPPAGDWSSLLAPGYLAERARRIGAQSMREAPAGVPPGAVSGAAPAPEQVEHGTSHLSVVDAQGRSVAMTTTIEDQFGARLFVEGFFLNNELTDFSFAPADAQGRPIANRVEGGKRPRSSMTPTFVFEQPSGRLVLNVGSMGGAMIIHQVAKTVYGVLQWGLDAQRAIELPNFGTNGERSVVEAGRVPREVAQALRERGHAVQEVPITGGAHAVQATADGWFGAADIRRDGIARGD